jgi:hypothetical protein
MERIVTTHIREREGRTKEQVSHRPRSSLSLLFFCKTHSTKQTLLSTLWGNHHHHPSTKHFASFKADILPGMVMHDCNPSTLEAEAG